MIMSVKYENLCKGKVLLHGMSVLTGDSLRRKEGFLY